MWKQGMIHTDTTARLNGGRFDGENIVVEEPFLVVACDDGNEDDAI